jgi:glutathione synthase/RimK-type ligase-like ATP-grasp enzyme
MTKRKGKTLPVTGDPSSLDPAVHRALAEAKRAAGDQLAALAHLIAVQTLEAHAAGITKSDELSGVATGYFMKGDYETSGRWYRLVIAIDPGCAIAFQNLAAIHDGKGEAAEAELYRQQAYRIQRVFVDQEETASRRVLVLCAGRTSGNTPFTTLIPTAASVRVKYALDYAAEDEDGRLPPYDLVFNAIGEPDAALEMAERLRHFEQGCRRPVLNPLAAIARTQRHQLTELLTGLEDVATTPCARFDQPAETPDALAARLEAADLTFPLLARPVSSHGGDGLARCDTLEELEAAIHAFAGAYYLTGYADYRSADGFFRKYRMIFVDRQPFPYHQAISPDWMVHYFSADMERNPWKLEEEKRFLSDPEAALGARAMDAVRAIGKRLDLDYGGIDFTLLPDGRVFVFEANATMLVHRERANGLLAHKNQPVQRIVEAFEAMLDSHR